MKKQVLHMIVGVMALIFSGSLLFADNKATTEVVEVENIAALREVAQADGTVYRITGQVILTHQNGNRNQKYFQDETGAILIDDPRPSGTPVGTPGIIVTTYKEYDAIAGLTGTITIYNQMMQMIPTEDPGPALSANNVVEPLELTIEQFGTEHQAMLIKIKAVSITIPDGQENFATSRSYTITDGTGTSILRTPNASAGLDYINTPIPTTQKDITGVFVQFNNDFQITPRSLSDMEIYEVPTIAILRRQKADNSTVYTLTGEALLSYQQTFRNKKWIQDATAGIEIDDNGGIITTAYNIGDGITGIQGKLNLNRSMLQFVPVEDPGEATSADNELLVIEKELAALTSEDQGRLVLINNVQFDESLFGTNFATGRNLNITDPSGAGVFRTEFFQADYIGTPIPVVPNNIIVIVRQYDATMQITARSLADFQAAGEVEKYTVTFAIVGENKEALENAVIKFGEETYDAGQYVLENILPGTYQYAVSLEGYHTYSGQLIVTTEDVDQEVMLIAEDAHMVTEFPMEEGFEDAFPPTGWRIFRNPDFNTWVSHPTANSGSAAAFHASTNPEQDADSWLVSPQIQLPEEESMLFSFFERNAFMNDYRFSGVYISTGSGDPANDQYELLRESNTAAGTYAERTLNLSDYKGKIVYLAFVYRGADGHQWWVDDVKIAMAPDVIDVPNIAALREQAQADGTVYRITGPVIMTHKNGNRNQKYFQDETGAILIDDPWPSGSPVGTPGVITTNYEEYDAVVGLTGKILLYNQMWQLVPTVDPGPPVSSGNVVEPLVLTIEQFDTAHQAKLIKIENVSITIPAGETNFASSKSYTITDGTGTGILRTPNANAGLDYFNTPVPTTVQDIVGIFVQFNNDFQISPRSLADFKDVDDTNVPETNVHTLMMYPNPASTQFTLEHNKQIDMVRILDLSGRLVISQQLHDSRGIIDTGTLGNGLYIVQVIASDEVTSMKLQIINR